MCFGGGGGGGGAQQVTSTVTQSNLPAYVQPYFEQVLQRGLYESARPYEPFRGQRLAQFAPEETYAQQNIMGLQRPEQMGFASDIAARQAVSSLADPGAVSRYMDPYARAVTDIERREAVRSSEMQRPQIGAEAVRSGAFGGTRSALLEAERQRNLGQQLSDIEARSGQRAFEQAQRAFEADRAARMGAAELLGGLGSQQQALDLQRLSAQLGVGGERRGLMQRGLDLGYEDFLRQQAYGREQLGYLSNLLQGVPIQPGSTVSTFGRVPSAEQQLLGSGLGALGLYKSLGSGGG